MRLLQALVTNIQGYSVHDGPGIRTLVFLKGCGLACRWCANPETISRKAEVGFIKTLCTQCENCAGVCPEDALNIDKNGPQIDRQRCTGCGRCVSACSYKALVLYGKKMNVGEVFDAVKRDDMFYRASGGGVTVSGGEPLLQPEFVSALFAECHGAGINTCIETAGFVQSAALLSVLPFTDYVLYDIKHLNPAMHRQFTGQPNDLMLANARILAGSGVEFLFRMPLIPGVNDSLENIRETAAFLSELGDKAKRIELMPYHRLGESKYQALGRPYRLHGLQAADPVRLESVKKAFEENGIRCSISG